MQSKPKAYLRDRFYVPAEYVSDDILRQYESRIEIGTNALSKEKIYEDIRHYDLMQITADQAFYIFNRGDLAKLYRLFGDRFDIQDERISADMVYDLKIDFPDGFFWKDYQLPAIDALLDYEYGILQAPTRSGKTLLLTSTICAERQRTLVMAHQKDLLLQFIDTFEKFTNVNALRKQSGQRIIGIPEKWEDFYEFDVVFATKQTFEHTVGQMHLPVLQKMFGMLLVDESHFTGADVYSTTVNRFWARKRQGCTATPARKDGLHVIVQEVLGPVIHEVPVAVVNRPRIEVSFEFGGLQVKKKLGYAAYLNMVVKSKTRNKTIARAIWQDVQDGHSVIAVTDRKKHCYELARLLEEAGVPTVTFTGDVTTKEKRTNVLDRMRTRDARVMISMRSMLTGLDIPCADVFHNITPTANVVADGEEMGGGGYEQQCSRILTPYPGKQKAMIRDWIDAVGVSWACKKVREKTYVKIGAKLVYSAKVKEKEDVRQQSLFMAAKGSSTEF